MLEERRCRRDGVRLDTHAACRLCLVLVGPRHAYTALYDGLCLVCARQGEWLSTAEAARRLRVRPATIRKWIRMGRLAAHSVSREDDSPQGVRYRVLVADLEHLLARREHSQILEHTRANSSKRTRPKPETGARGHLEETEPRLSAKAKSEVQSRASQDQAWCTCSGAG